MNKKVLTNFSWLVGCHIVQSILSLLVSMAAARYLGPTNYGLVNYAASLTAFVLPIVQLGLNSTLVQQINEHPEKEGETIGSAVGSSILSSILCIFSILCFVLIVNQGEEDTLVVCALYSVSLVFQSTQMIQYWFQAKLMSKYIAVTSVGARVIVAAYRIILLVTGKSVYWFAVANAVDYLFISAILFRCYGRLGGKKFRFSWQRLSELLNQSKYYILSSLMVVIFGQTDKIMLKLMLGNEASGLYSAAITCAGMSAFVFTAIIDSMRPVILKDKTKNLIAYKRNLIRLYAMVFYLAICQSIVLTAGAKYVVQILYGNAYDGAVSILRVITWYSAFSYIGPVRNIWILAEGKQKCLWIINLLGAIVNVIGNFLTIPCFGAVGAAATSVVTQVFTNFVLCIVMKELRPCAKHMILAMHPKTLFQFTQELLKTGILQKGE